MRYNLLQVFLYILCMVNIWFERDEGIILGIPV